MGKYQEAKRIARDYYDAMEQASPEQVAAVLKEFTAPDYDWKSSHPFRELKGIQQVADEFWIPLKRSLQNMQRRQDIFIAGNNAFNEEEIWVMSMGNFMGNFEEDWLGIRRTRKMNNLRYAEFSCIQDGKIAKTGLFMDILGFMHHAGVDPLPPQTGAFYVYPGPKDHNGLLFEDAPAEEGIKTLDAVDKMCDDLTELDAFMACPPAEHLENTWDKNMIWYGPYGDGCSYTTDRYRDQHMAPFRLGLKDKTYNGHEVRFAEGNFACFFGWPNLTNTPVGGYMGLPGGEVPGEMQVVDVYYRKDVKLSENWVIVDMPHWLNMQGLDILKRTSEIVNP